MAFFKDRVAPMLKDKEGGYVDHPSDRGGPTNHGITRDTARRYGYLGDMRSMPFEVALSIYEKRYVNEPGFDDVARINEPIALELIDTGVNMGQRWPCIFFQQSLNAFNMRGRHYADIKVDGDIGPTTLRALETYLQRRGQPGVRVMLRALNALQGGRYFDITPANDQNEDFMFGWFSTRVEI
jgi:lysozyme family protein